MKIEELVNEVNIAEKLDPEQLSEIGQRAVQGYEIDEDSRSEWREMNEQAMKIAKQTIEKKTHPFPGASNVKFPLITKSAIDFAARTYPEIVQGDRVVNLGVLGTDPEGQKARRAARVSKHMTYQLLQESDEWEEGTDKLLHILPIIGTVFRKVYHDPIQKRVIKELCHPDKIVVNYDVPSLEVARRITHLMPMYANDIVERIRAGIYLDVDVDAMKHAEGYDIEDSDPALEILEQHCYLDLDEDGYAEPYIVTLHNGTKEVLRIVARYDGEGIETNEEGDIQRIKPIQYFVDYHMIKSPDGGFYSLGLGQLLYPINETINTTLNQIIDAGTLSNSQAGFIGRGLRIKGGQLKVRLGEWKVLDAATGTDIKNNIVPLPVREPSTVLFQMLGFLVEAGKDLADIQDTLQGKGPTQNVAATTVLTLVEQGMKVFNAVQKRLRRAFKKEFKRIYHLNRKYLSDKEYKNVVDDPEANVELDYNTTDFDVAPVTDPSAGSDAQRMARAKVLTEIPGLDPYFQTLYMLEAMQIPDAQIKALLPPPNPQEPPPPEMQKVMVEIEKLQADIQANSETRKLKLAELELKQRQTEIMAQEASARISKMDADAAVNFAKLQNVRSKQELETIKEEIRMRFEKDKAAAELAIRAAETNIANKKVDQDKDVTQED